MGIAFAPLTSAGIAGVAPADAGAASGLLNVAQQLGASLGLGILITVFAAATRSAADHPLAGASAQLETRHELAHAVATALTGSAVFLLLALAVVVGAHAAAGAGMTDLAGTRALVTGGTSGLGLAMARALVDAGARVAITSRDAARASDAAAALGPGAVGLALDVRDEGAAADGVAEAWELLGGIDLLVNNAGIGMRTVNPRFLSHPQPFWEVEPDGFRDVLATKVTGCFLVARAVVPRMLAAGGGRVVTISMSPGTMVREGFVPYGPAGAAVEALSRVMAADLAGSAVTVNLLLPGGATSTGMVPEDVPASTRSRLLDPAIMGPPIVWLASAAAAGVHDERVVASGFEEWVAGRRGALGRRVLRSRKRFGWVGGGWRCSAVRWLGRGGSCSAGGWSGWRLWCSRAGGFLGVKVTA